MSFHLKTEPKQRIQDDLVFFVHGFQAGFLFQDRQIHFGALGHQIVEERFLSPFRVVNDRMESVKGEMARGYQSITAIITGTATDEDFA